MQRTYSILSTIAASAADIVLDNHILSITGCPKMDFRKIKSVGPGYVVPVAETLGVQTVSNTGANSTAYKFVISQLVNGTSSPATVVVGTTSPASGSTTTTVSTSLKADINSRANLSVAATGTTTTIITAVTRSPIINVTGVTGVTVVNTTAGVHSVGLYQDLVDIGVTGATAGKTYNQIEFIYEQDAAAPLNDMKVSSYKSHTLYVQSDATNFADFNTRMTEVLASFPSGGSTYPDHEALAL